MEPTPPRPAPLESRDIRAIVGPFLDAAIASVAGPGERYAYDITSQLVQAGQQLAVEATVYLSAPSPVVGDTMTAGRQVDLWELTRGDNALELIRDLIDHLRATRAHLLGITSSSLLTPR